MHWFEQLYRLYGERDIPLFHEWVYADILVDITASGEFASAAARRERTLIPVTEASASRTVNIAPHPLCDALQNLTEPRRKEAYLSYLREWAGSRFSDERLAAVLKYTERGTLTSDLIRSGISPQDGSVVSFSVDGKRLCGDKRLIASHIEFTRSLPCETGICCVSGERTALCAVHPKRLTSQSSSAKLISKRERERLNFGGVFHSADDAFPIGREVSFKAHAVLKRLIAEGALRLGQRCFIAFDERGNSLPLPLYSKPCEPVGAVTVLGLCEATKGRLSVTFYRRISAQGYLRALEAPSAPLPARHSGYHYERLLNRILF